MIIHSFDNKLNPNAEFPGFPYLDYWGARHFTPESKQKARKYVGTQLKFEWASNSTWVAGSGTFT